MPKGMNIQGKLITDSNGKTKVVNGIEWTKTILPDGNEYQGYTMNPVGGCMHRCRWIMPDSEGSKAICYAEAVANRISKKAYSEGFEHHYWRPGVLASPALIDKPVKIFLDSMSDLFGHWVPENHVTDVLQMVRDNPKHVFQSLTKNTPGMLKYKDLLPPNLWAGFSTPPDFMWSNELTVNQKVRYLHKALEVASELAGIGLITWCSFEPLSWDVSSIVAEYPGALRWSVIGAASDGPRKFQPNASDVQALLDVLDDQEVPVFYKGNLRGNAAAEPWREEFPALEARYHHVPSYNEAV